MNENVFKLMRLDSAATESITLDCDHLLAHAGGDPELLIQLCTRFLCELPIYMQGLRASLDECALPACRAVQQLQNSLMIFGFGTVSVTAEALDAAIRSGRRREAKREWQLLENQLKALVPQVQRLLLQMSTPKTPVQ